MILDQDIAPGLYRHYKGPLYRVLGSSRHSETEEVMVIYQALYGEKGYWCRPLSMFTELVKLQDGTTQPRFDRLEEQTIVLERAELCVKPDQVDDFISAFSQAEPLIQRQTGYLDHKLSRNITELNQFLLQVHWQRLEDHTQGFRQSEDYQRWRELLHHFYDPFPEVEYFSVY
ncbi:MAG: DUF1653 domain-containing protein [Pseudomonadota bacterium]